MKNLYTLSLIIFLLFNFSLFSQDKNKVIDGVLEESYSNSQLEILAHELLDDIGPRLVGTPQMQKAHDWAVAKFESWNISAENQQWGEWKGIL